MQQPQPDDSARQACVVRRRAMRGLWVGIVAGWLRFMHQRQSVLTPGAQRSRSAPIDFASIGHPTTKTQYVVTHGRQSVAGLLIRIATIVRDCRPCVARPDIAESHLTAFELPP